MKKRFSWVLMVAIFFQIFGAGILPVRAASAGQVVINEIAWAGSADNSNDEWIELYNTTNAAIDLSGWVIDDDNGSALYTIESGVIEAGRYFLIEDSESSVNNVTADALIGLSLANTGDSLVLKNSAGDIIDGVNTAGGMWYAGDSTTKASMERIDPEVSLDSAENWDSAVMENGSVSSLGSAILGTPGSVNSNYAGSGFGISLSSSAGTVYSGDTVTVQAAATDATDMYAYGFDIVYDPSVLNFVSASEGSFLSSDGASTSFMAALENGVEGKIVLGGSRLVNPASGIDGSGELFQLSFQVVGSAGSASDISFAGASFVADSVGDVPASYGGVSVSVEDGTVNSVEGLTASLGDTVYSLRLDWSEPIGGADSYIVTKEMPDGSYIMIGETTELFFVDAAAMPNVDHNYQVVAVRSGVWGVGVAVSGIENRGLKGDNDRNSRVDGRDIEGLARSYGAIYGEESYDSLKDSNYDGIIDGSDLIDIGSNFGLSV